MLEIYLIRHGKSLGQVSNFVHDAETSLSEKGVQQITTLIPFLKDVQLDQIYSSPLKRAIESADILSSALNIPSEIETDFGEWDYGGCSKMTWSEHRQKYPKLHIASGEFDPDYKVADAESYNEFVQRVHSRALKLKTKDNENRKVAIVSHFCALNIIANTLLELPIREEFCFEFLNGSVSKITIRSDFPVRLNFSNRIFYQE